MNVEPYPIKANDYKVSPVNLYGFEAAKAAWREAMIEEMLKIIDDVKSDANKGYMFNMVDEIKDRILALRGGEQG